MDIKLKCSCGAVQGKIINVSPDNGNRVVCCCDDCQRFAAHLKRNDDILDRFGGTDIFQTSQSQVRIKKGAGHLQAIRLTDKGLTRWYTDCCNTPVANTINADFPFAGIIHSFMNIKGSKDSVLGPVRAYVQVKHASGTPDYPYSAAGFPISVTLKLMLRIFRWKVKGMQKPSPFFDEDGKPVSRPQVLG